MRLSGTYRCVFLTKSLRCKRAPAVSCQYPIQPEFMQVWAHLHHESCIAAPVMQLLALDTTTDRTLRAAALALLEALVGLPWEYIVLQDMSWAHPVLGALLSVFCGFRSLFNLRGSVRRASGTCCCWCSLLLHTCCSAVRAPASRLLLCRVRSCFTLAALSCALLLHACCSAVRVPASHLLLCCAAGRVLGTACCSVRGGVSDQVPLIKCVLVFCDHILSL